jgi:hypothetical protein
MNSLKKLDDWNIIALSHEFKPQTELRKSLTQIFFLDSTVLETDNGQNISFKG